jgi:tetratricopeptide (TPR) repeat protein
MKTVAGNIRAFWCVMTLLYLSARGAVMAADGSFTNLLKHGDIAAGKTNIAEAIKFYDLANRSAGGSSADLCVLARHYCDLMYDTGAPDVQEQLARRALTCSQQAVKANGSNATAHLCVAVCYAKNFPYVDRATKVSWSKAIRTEGETAIALDPRQDLGYYLLGRWNYDTANLNILYKGLIKLVYGGLPQSSNEEAVKDFKKAIALAPNRILHHVALARAYETTGQTKLAVAELEKCRGLKPLDRDDVAAQKEAAALLARIRS